MYFHYQNQTERQSAEKPLQTFAGKKKWVDINTRRKMAAALLHEATNHMIPVFPKRFPHEEEKRILSGVKIPALTTTGKQNDLYLLPLVSERYFGLQPNRKTVNFRETKVRLVSL